MTKPKVGSRQEGSAAAAMLLLIAGGSLFMAQSEMKSLKSKVDQAKVVLASDQATLQNSSSLQVAARLLRSASATQAAPIHLQTYITTNTCNQNRSLVVAQGAQWQSTANVITVRNFTSEQLRVSNSEIFNSLQNGQAVGLVPADATTMRILGFRCSSDPLKPYLVEGVYVEAKEQDVQRRKAMLSKAFLPMEAPPPSSCRLYIRDKDGAVKAPSEAGTPIVLSELEGTLHFECNNVVTRAYILDQTHGAIVEQTRTDPVTPANAIDDGLKAMFPPIALSSLTAGTQSLLGIAEQVDGTQLTFLLDLDVSQVKPDPDPQTCESSCDSVAPVSTCDPNAMVHRESYQERAPDKWVCYQCGNYYGFDPKQNCANIGIVSQRGNGGCFDADTLIRVADQKSRKIKDLLVGDQVWNPLLNRTLPIKHIVRGYEHKPMYKVSSDGQTVEVTSEHPFLTKLGLMGASQLQVGDTILNSQQAWSTVESVVQIAPGPQKEVWNIELDTPENDERNHMLLANDILTGDYYLQQRVSQRAHLELLGDHRR